MRHIVFDTETTGFEAEGADRIVEIGAIELINYVPTGKTYHQYINPERDIPVGASNIHGITEDKVRHMPTFSEIVGAFQEFISDSPLVAHNAEFDMRFINAEFKRFGFTVLPATRFIDTLAIARKLFPGAPASLDALCKRYNVDASTRIFHGALLDSQLLAEVYLELVGGRQPDLIGGGKGNAAILERPAENVEMKNWAPREHGVNAEELAAHEKMLAGIPDAMWKK
jgi:DNA polymerase-3 subunit epsilon